MTFDTKRGIVLIHAWAVIIELYIAEIGQSVDGLHLDTPGRQSCGITNLLSPYPAIPPALASPTPTDPAPWPYFPSSAPSG